MLAVTKKCITSVAIRERIFKLQKYTLALSLATTEKSNPNLRSVALPSLHIE
jgi:hypothetical protein